MSLNKYSHKINIWLADNYGSRRGALRTYWYRLLYLFGKYHAYRQINWASIDRLVFVCKGNICRSAYAEAVSKSLGVESISCGVDTTDGYPANLDAIKVATQRGFDLTNHKTTRIQGLLIKKKDLIIAMEPWQIEYLKNKYKYNACTLLGLWGDSINPHIQDPYRATGAYFHNCFNLIEKSVYGIIKKN